MQLEPTSRWRSASIELFVLREEHVGADYVRWLNDPRVNRYLESRFAVHSIDSTRHFVHQCLQSSATLLLGIRDLVLGGLHVGNIKLGPIDRHHGLGEVGLLIGEPQSWGRGLASAAIARVRDIAAEQLGLRKLTAGCYASNVGSEKAFLRAGFEVEGRRRGHFLLDGVQEDLVLMATWLKPSIVPAL
jgi:ribosomal-protein-alanine N-acetyltransferase